MTERLDDPSIGDGDLLWRRIIPSPLWVLPQPDGSYRVSSAAFIDNHTGEVSVALAALTTPERLLEAYPSFSLTEVPAGAARALGYRIVRDPTPDDPAHALICPPPGRSKHQRKADARRLASLARWVVFRPPAQDAAGGAGSEK
jgi:hypothetical protein